MQCMCLAAARPWAASQAGIQQVDRGLKSSQAALTVKPLLAFQDPDNGNDHDGQRSTRTIGTASGITHSHSHTREIRAGFKFRARYYKPPCSSLQLEACSL